jgi:hypothetical protein
MAKGPRRPRPADAGAPTARAADPRRDLGAFGATAQLVARSAVHAPTVLQVARWESEAAALGDYSLLAVGVLREIERELGFFVTAGGPQVASEVAALLPPDRADLVTAWDRRGSGPLCFAAIEAWFVAAERGVAWEPSRVRRWLTDGVPRGYRDWLPRERPSRVLGAVRGLRNRLVHGRMDVLDPHAYGSLCVAVVGAPSIGAWLRLDPAAHDVCFHGHLARSVGPPLRR